MTGYKFGDERIEPRFWAQVTIADDGCWVWTGVIDRRGYGRVWRSNPHRITYLTLVGEIPEPLVLDHLCRNRACCNPAHLEPVTRAENSLRGQSPSILKHFAKVCGKGHAVDEANSYVSPSTGRARCLKCIRDKQAATSADPEKRAAHAAKQRARYHASRKAQAACRDHHAAATDDTPGGDK